MDSLRREINHDLKQCLYVENCDQLEAFEDKLLKNPEFGADAYNADHLWHKTVNGMHSRILFISKGDFLTGRIHKAPYIDILVSGKVIVRSFMEDGSEEPAEVHIGPKFFEGREGRKRVLEAIEDCVWITVDRTEHTEIEDIKREVVFMKMDEYRKHANIIAPKSDYESLLEEFNLTEAFMWEKSNSEDVVETPSNFELRPSPVHGLGMFATKDIESGEFIGKARENGVKTFLGRYVNHAKENNGVITSGTWGVYATKNISIGQELLFNYRDTMGYKRGKS